MNYSALGTAAKIGDPAIHSLAGPRPFQAYSFSSVSTKAGSHGLRPGFIRSDR